MTRRAALSIAPVLSLPVLAGTAAARPEGAFAPGWAWADDFRALDARTWTAREGFMDANSLDGVNLARQVTVAGGWLRLRTELLTPTRQVEGKTARYRAGYVWSRGKRHLGYGRTDVRMRMLPAGRSAGMWSGVWFRDTRGLGEIDLCEAIGTPNRRPVYYPADGTGYSQTVYRNTGVKTSPHHQVLGRLDSPADDWHTYTLEQRPTAISMYIDGKRTFHTTNRAILAGFSGSLDIRFSQFVGEAWGARPSTRVTAAPNDLLVGWIRHSPW